MFMEEIDFKFVKTRTNIKLRYLNYRQKNLKYSTVQEFAEKFIKYILSVTDIDELKNTECYRCSSILFNANHFNDCVQVHKTVYYKQAETEEKIIEDLLNLIKNTSLKESITLKSPKEIERTLKKKHEFVAKIIDITFHSERFATLCIKNQNLVPYENNELEGILKNHFGTKPSFDGFNYWIQTCNSLELTEIIIEIIEAFPKAEYNIIQTTPFSLITKIVEQLQQKAKFTLKTY